MLLTKQDMDICSNKELSGLLAASPPLQLAPHEHSISSLRPILDSVLARVTPDGLSHRDCHILEHIIDEGILEKLVGFVENSAWLNDCTLDEFMVRLVSEIQGNVKFPLNRFILPHIPEIGLVSCPPLFDCPS